jgi:spermidine synthase
MLRIFIVTSIIFFIPGCVLGTISPVVVRLTLKNIEHAGNVIGKIYALSTLGAIIGTFVTGFFLISWLGTKMIVLSMGAVLIFVAILSGSWLKKNINIALFCIIFIGIVFPSLWVVKGKDSLNKFNLSGGTYCYKESDYYTIKLTKTTSGDEKTKLEAMILDHLIHSYVSLNNPLHIEYEYERIYADVLKWKFKKNTGFKSLTIGGGGYTFPRYMEISYPNAHVDVVEIDPQVTKIVYGQLGLPHNTKITTYNTDGRWYVMNCKDKYDLVFTDAYNDLSIPYHLTTKEFAEEIKGIMKPNAILMSNIIDNFQKGAFLPSYIKTLREVFGQKNVYLISVSPKFRETRISTFIVLASNGNLDIGAFGRFVRGELGRHATSAVVPEDLMEEFINKKHSIIITDDYAPVDNLIAPIFEERFGYNRKS